MAQAERVIGGRYRVEQVLGDGGMARVFKALDERLGRPVAIKILHAHYNSQPEFVARFEKEAQLAASLSHPNIIGIYDIGHDADGTRYIVMEYVNGENLKSLIRREAPLPLPLATAICRQLCLALDYAHSHGVIHRDIKPENIFLTPTRQVKVGDFGIARALNSTDMTSTGTVLGSVSYFSPEQAQGQLATARSDLYSTGIVLYEMLTRYLPFTADNALAVAMKHITDAPAPPSSLNPRLGPAIDAVVLKAMAKDPARRYGSGADLAGALAREASSAAPSPTAPVAANLGPTAPLPTPVPPRTGLPPTVSGAAVAVAGRAAPGPLRGPQPGPLSRPAARRSAWAPAALALLLLSGLAGGIALGRNALQAALQPGATATPPATSGPRTPESAAGGGVPGVADSPTPTVTTATATTAGSSPTPTTPTSTPVRPSATPTVARTAQVALRDVRGAIIPAYGVNKNTFSAIRPTITFDAGTTEAYALARWPAIGPGHIMDFRWTLPTGHKDHWSNPSQCQSQFGVCYTQIPLPMPGQYHVALYAGSVAIAHADFTLASAQQTATPVTGAATVQAQDSLPPGQAKKLERKQATVQARDSLPPGQAKKRERKQAKRAAQGGGNAAGPAAPAAAAPASDTAAVTAAVYRANDTYYQVLNRRDTSGLDAAFGPNLAAINRSRAAGLANAGQHYNIGLVGMRISGVRLLGGGMAQATGVKTESVELLSDAGQVLTARHNETYYFTDLLQQRPDGQWVVVKVNN